MSETDASGRKSAPRARAFGLGLAHALLIGASFPPLGLWWLVFVAPLPLFVLAVRPGGSSLSAGFWAMLGAAPFWIWTHAWIANVSMAGVYPLVVYLSLYTWAFVVVGVRAARIPRIPAAVGLAIAWVGLEFLRARVAWTGYPWYLTGHPLIDSPGLAAPAAVGGVSLVSLLAVMPSAWFAARRASPRWLAAAYAGAILAWIAGAAWWWRTPATGTTPVRIGIVQTDVPQDNRMDWTVVQRLIDWKRMRDLVIDAGTADPPPDLIVLPEGLMPGWTFDPVSLAHERDRGIVWRLEPEDRTQAAAIAEYGDMVPATQVADELLAVQRGLGVPMLVGSVAFDALEIVNRGGAIEYDSAAMFNSAFLVRHGRVADVWYDKVHLTPFGEIMPYISAWPWLESRLLAIGAQGMSFALTPGRTARTIPLDRADAAGVELATPICFEATMAGVCRRLARIAKATGRPMVMVNITNDGWFADSDRGRLMHELGARWRCVELGVPMARVANTGVSGAIDARGRVIDRAPPRQAGVLFAELAAAAPGTPFVAVGEWPGWLALFATPILAFLGRSRKCGEPRGPDE